MSVVGCDAASLEESEMLAEMGFARAPRSRGIVVSSTLSRLPLTREHARLAPLLELQSAELGSACIEK